MVRSLQLDVPSCLSYGYVSAWRPPYSTRRNSRCVEKAESSISLTGTSSSRHVEFANNDTAKRITFSRERERAIHSAKARLAVVAETASPCLRRCLTGRAPAVPRRTYNQSFRNRGEACGLGPCRSVDRPTNRPAIARFERQSAGRCPMTPQKASWLALSLQPSPATDGVGWRSGGEGWRARRR